MPYSVSAPTPQYQTPNFNSVNMGISDAYSNMTAGLERIGKVFNDLHKWNQDNANARFINQINKYSNDPAALAEAYKNGQIDATDVTQETLAKYAPMRNQFIQSEDSIYDYNRKKELQSFETENAGLINAWRQAAQNGDQKLADMYLQQLIDKGINPATAMKYGLDPFDKQMKQKQLAIQELQARAAMANAANGSAMKQLQLKSYEDALQEKAYKQIAHQIGALVKTQAGGNTKAYQSIAANWGEVTPNDLSIFADFKDMYGKDLDYDTYSHVLPYLVDILGGNNFVPAGTPTQTAEGLFKQNNSSQTENDTVSTLYGRTHR